MIIAFMLSFFVMEITAANEEKQEHMVQRELAEEVLRFHVRANSDKEEDQEIKMRVKSVVVAYLQKILQEVDSKGQASHLVMLHKKEISKVIAKQLQKENCTYGFEIQIQKEWFPQRTYGDCTFPKGVYEAVIISLGKGRGQNWWCMIYPGLCFLDETYAVVSKENKEDLEDRLSDETYAWVINPDHIKVSYRFKWLHWK